MAFTEHRHLSQNVDISTQVFYRFKMPDATKDSSPLFPPFLFFFLAYLLFGVGDERLKLFPCGHRTRRIIGRAEVNNVGLWQRLRMNINRTPGKQIEHNIPKREQARSSSANIDNTYSA